MPDPNLLGEFLRARRELVRPEEHGLPDRGHRRVPGLRREEVSMLAGVSAEYYIRLERGRDRNPSIQVLDALSDVLGLDQESRNYLASLVAPASRGHPAPSGTIEPVSPSVLRLMQSTPGVPAFVLGRFMDVLACNRAAEVRCTADPCTETSSGTSSSIRQRGSSTPTGPTLPPKPSRLYEPRPAGTSTIPSSCTSSANFASTAPTSPACGPDTTFGRRPAAPSESTPRPSAN